MPNWLPGSSKAQVPQAPYYQQQQAHRPVAASRSVSDLRTTIARSPTPSPADQSELPYRMTQTPGRRPSQTTPPVPQLPAQYARVYPSGSQNIGHGLTPPTSVDSETDVSSGGSPHPNSPVTDIDGIETAQQRAFSARARAHAGARSASMRRDPAVPAPIVPPLPIAGLVPTAGISNMRVHTEASDNEAGVFFVEMRYTITIREGLRR